MKTQAIVTDIEGMPEFVSTHAADGDIAALLDDARREAGEPDASTERTIEILLAWIREDRKATPLKTLQGHIWKRGYEHGDFTGHIYADAVDGLRRWAADGIRLFVYSSGSIGAQKLLFGHSDAGDLTPLFEGYFDTVIGPKKEADSYRNIVAAIGVVAADILFLSDVAGELDAAAAAGMRTCQLVRDDDVVPGDHPTASDFTEVIIGDDAE
jgi:enolase-phosphatase E1